MKYLKSYEQQNIQPKIEYYNNGQKFTEAYFLNNKFHRKDGPAVQIWYKNGQIETKEYYINDKHHREDGPAIQRWYNNGQKMTEIYYLNGKQHREDGPAYQHWIYNKQKENTLYYLYDILYTRKRWLEKLKEINSPHYEDQLMKYQTEQYNI